MLATLRQSDLTKINCCRISPEQNMHRNHIDRHNITSCCPPSMYSLQPGGLQRPAKELPAERYGDVIRELRAHIEFLTEQLEASAVAHGNSEQRHRVAMRESDMHCAALHRQLQVCRHHIGRFSICLHGTGLPVCAVDWFTYRSHWCRLCEHSTSCRRRRLPHKGCSFAATALRQQPLRRGSAAVPAAGRIRTAFSRSTPRP